MTANADILLFAYTLVLVGTSIGVQMLYAGLAGKTMDFGGAEPILPHQAKAAGAVFSVAGGLAIAVFVVEILSGAAGTDIRAFIAATVVVPPVVLAFTARRAAGAAQRPNK